MQRRRRRRQRLPCGLRVREYFRQFIAFLFSNVGVICLVVGYIIAGAFIFQAIEGSSELERVQSMARHRQLAVERLWYNATVPLNIFDEVLWKHNVSAELRQYQQVIVWAVRKGWDGSDDIEFYRQWSFPGSFLYSLTIITTIGYGNIAPRTDWGKVTTIFYAMLGMPLFLLYLTNLGDLLARSFKWFYVNLCLCRGCPGIAKRRATRLRMKIQAQLGEPLELLNSAQAARERRRSAPEPRQRCSDIEISIPLDTRLPATTRRGASVPNYSGRNEMELEFRRKVTEDRQRQRLEYKFVPYREDLRIDGRQKSLGLGRVEYSYDMRKNGHDVTDKNRNNTDEFNQYRIQYTNANFDEERKIYNLDEFHTFRNEHRDEIEQQFNRRIDRYSDRFQEYYNEGVNESCRREVKDTKRKFQRQEIGYGDKDSNFIMNNGSQTNFWQGSQYLLRQSAMIEDNESICSYQFCDPIDNYGKIEHYIGDEAADSDEFTYITIDSQNVTVPITICVFIMVGYIIFGAVLFSMWEEWDTVDGSYFCFISLTSIGFGDIVPGERIYARAASDESTKRIDTSFILCSMYLLFGMALVAMCFNLMQEQVVQYIAGAKRVLRNICRCQCR